MLMQEKEKKIISDNLSSATQICKMFSASTLFFMTYSRSKQSISRYYSSHLSPRYCLQSSSCLFFPLFLVLQSPSHKDFQSEEQTQSEPLRQKSDRGHAEGFSRIEAQLVLFSPSHVATRCINSLQKSQNMKGILVEGLLAEGKGVTIGLSTVTVLPKHQHEKLTVAEPTT